VQAQLVVLARLEDGGLERPEMPRKVELAFVVEFLSGKTSTAYLVKAARMAARSSAAIGPPSVTSPTSAAKSGVIGWTVMVTGSSCGSSRSCV
jgi:hypothetical protein